MNKEEIADLLASKASVSQDIADEIATEIYSSTPTVTPNELTKIQAVTVGDPLEVLKFSELSTAGAAPNLEFTFTESILPDPAETPLVRTAEAAKLETEFEESIKQIDRHQAVNAELASRIDSSLSDLAALVDTL